MTVFRSPPRHRLTLRKTQVVLSAVEDTLRDQKSEFTPTAYFAALLSLLAQFITSSKGIVNKDVATAVVYLLDLVTPTVPSPLLRSKFSQILQTLAVALTHPDAEAPLLRASIGCLESLLLVQDSQAWALSHSEISPRRAVAGLLAISTDHRPKVRKRALEALSKVLKNPPPSPSLDHPAADMCAESALMTLKVVVEHSKKQKKHQPHKDQHQGPNLMHALQLVKTIALASGGWPSRKIDSLCEILLGISRSSNEHLTMAAFEVFEVMFAGMTDEVSSAKLPRVLEVIADLQPSENDSQLLPPWLAVVSRGYDISSQVNAEDTFQNLPDVFQKISHFLNSMSHNVRVSAAECLISLLVNCVPLSVILEPSIFDEKVLEKLAKIVTDLLSVKYQSAWMEVFTVVGAMLDNLRWRSTPILNHAVTIIGELRTHESFNGKTEADTVIAKAIRAMGPDAVLAILPLNLGVATDEPGRAWMLPLLRDAASNTELSHFRSELVPLSERMFQKVIDHQGEKTMEVKIFETIVHQIWATLPGYCDLPMDLQTVSELAFSSSMTYTNNSQGIRSVLCRANLKPALPKNRASSRPLSGSAESRNFQSRIADCIWSRRPTTAVPSLDR
jgi:ribosomal RNA-processing protein 12